MSRKRASEFLDRTAVSKKARGGLIEDEEGGAIVRPPPGVPRSRFRSPQVKVYHNRMWARMFQDCGTMPDETRASLFAGITQGFGGNQRIGNKIRVKRVMLRMVFELNENSYNLGEFATDWAVNDTGTVYVILDKWQSGQSTNVSEVFNQSDQIPVVNPDNEHRFKILRRVRLESKNWFVDNAGEFWSSFTVIRGNGKRSHADVVLDGDWEVGFNSNTFGDSRDINDNNMYLIANTYRTDTRYSLDCTWQVWYTDQ